MINVLFVCTGNTCRSPMAEALLKARNNEGIVVRSAGIFASNGQDASKYAKEVLKENNIEHHHQSKQLSVDDIQWATHILTMTESHAAIIRDLYPEYKNKVSTLKGYVNSRGNNMDVLDPFGGQKEDYRHTFNELAELIEMYNSMIK